jgi:hypothetical protein
MSTAQFIALLLCAFCLAALLLGLIRPAWVLPSRRATRMQVLLWYSAASLAGPLLASEFPHRAAHAQSPDPSSEPAGDDASFGANLPGAQASRSLRLNEQEPEPESLRALASRMLLDLGLGSGRRLRVGRLTIAYEEPITEEQALALGEFLSRSEVGSGHGAVHGPGSGYGQVQVQVRPYGPLGQAAFSEHAAYEVRIATPFSRRQQLDPETRAAYQMVGLLASGIAFDGAPVHVHICTSLLRPLLVLRPQLTAAAILQP